MDGRVGAKREMLRHFLGALAYRTQKAIRDAPSSFAEFEAGNQVRTPKDLLRHMRSVLGYARTKFRGGHYQGDPAPTWDEEVVQFHQMLEDLSLHLAGDDPLDVEPEQLLQGPFADAMTHAGQLAMLRRLHGAPVPPENFIVADVSAENLTRNQPPPRSPDAEWPEAPQG